MNKIETNKQIEKLFKELEKFTTKTSFKYYQVLNSDLETIKSELDLHFTSYFSLLLNKHNISLEFDTIKKKLYGCILSKITEKLSRKEFYDEIKNQEVLEFQAENSNLIENRIDFLEKINLLSESAQKIIEFILKLDFEQEEKLLNHNDKINLIINSLLKRDKSLKRSKLNEGFIEIYQMLFKFDQKFDSFLTGLKTCKKVFPKTCENFIIDKQNNLKTKTLKRKRIKRFYNRKNQFDPITGKFLYSYYEFQLDFEFSICETYKKPIKPKTEINFCPLSERESFRNISDYHNLKIEEKIRYF